MGTPIAITPTLRNKLMPLSLAVLIIFLDQLTKWLIVKYIPLREIGAQFFGDLVRIIHVRNLGIAFSLGRDLPLSFRGIFFTILPVIVIIVLIVYYLRSNEFTRLQRWAVAGIIGGGIGNLIDRIFRPAGVVDFIDVKFFGIFWMDRWPTFNVADSSVVVCGILLAITLFFQRKKP